MSQTAKIDKFITLQNLEEFYNLLKDNFKASDTKFGGFKTGYSTSGKNYPVQLDNGGKAYVNVPWTSGTATQSANGLMYSGDKKKLDGIAEGANKYELPTASSNTLGGIKIGYTQTGKNYPVQLSDGKAYVNVPWTDTNTVYTLPSASKTALGGVKTGYTLNDKNYPVQLDNSGNAYVNVPWTDTNTEYTLPTAADYTTGGIRTGYVAGGQNYAVKVDSNSNAYVNVPWTDTKYTLPSATKDALGGIKIGFNQFGSMYPVKTIDDMAYVDVPDLTNITYNELKEKVKLERLIPGHKYRITDYNCDINGTQFSDNSYLDVGKKYGISSAKHQFDIIVTAISTKELSEDAKACHHEGDTYFKYCDLNAWEIKYKLSINNDDTSLSTKKYIRRDWSSVNGVIYYMKDEWGNEAPYDFKNIKFDNYYTFHLRSNNRDGTVPNINNKASTHTNNTIKPYYVIGTDTYKDENYKEVSGKNDVNIVTQLLNGIILMASTTPNANGMNGQSTTTASCSNNTFDYQCGNIFLYGDCKNNTFDKNCKNISLGSNSLNNTFTNNCSDIKFRIQSLVASKIEGSTRKEGKTYTIASPIQVIADPILPDSPAVDSTSTSTGGSTGGGSADIVLTDDAISYLGGNECIPYLENCKFDNVYDLVINLPKIYVNCSSQDITNATDTIKRYIDYVYNTNDNVRTWLKPFKDFDFKRSRIQSDANEIIIKDTSDIFNRRCETIIRNSNFASSSNFWAQYKYGENGLEAV